MASNQGYQGGSQGGGSSDRGFARMDDDQQRNIARKGGESGARTASPLKEASAAPRALASS
jgi:hypothetical protein